MLGGMTAPRRLIAFVAVLVLAGCGGDADEASARPSECADVIDVRIETSADGSYRFDVTVGSADTGWDKYADLWQVRSPDGSVLGTRELAHPHVDEQPFTRSLSGVTIPAGIDRVEIAARDSVEGFCGDTVVVALP